MPFVKDNSYRDRVYAEYNQQSTQAKDRLASRAPYLRWMIKRCFPADHECQILDLGCGDGALLHFLREADYTNCRGVDISPTQVEAAEQLGVKVERGDLMQALSLMTDKSLDVIVALDVIEHLTKSELLSFADEIYRALKDGGRWIIHCPNGDSPFFAAIRYGDWTHEQVFTSTSLLQVIKAAGFGYLSCQEDPIVPHGLKSAIRRLLWTIVRTVIRTISLIETGSASNIYTRNLLAIAVKNRSGSE